MAEVRETFWVQLRSEVLTFNEDGDGDGDGEQQVENIILLMNLLKHFIPSLNFDRD